MQCFKVFPATIIVDSNGVANKVPLVKGWNELATDDPKQLRLWQEVFRDRLKFWGVPCGAVNNIFVLDVDVKPSKKNPNRNGLKSLQELKLQVPETLVQRTPSGGFHYIFRAKANCHHPNTVDGETGLDTRGDRGWIAWYGDTNKMPIAPAPEWLWTFNSPKKSEVIGVSTIKIAPEIAEGIIKSSLDAVRTAAAGESNNVLNTESFRVGQLVGAGAITREFAETELFKVAKERGKPDYEAQATIRSGLDGGMKNPLSCPFPNTEPTSIIPMLPLPPEAPERWTPRFFTRSDLTNMQHLRKPQLFRDWSTEDIHITTADGGTGKTTMKLYEAICLALGSPFLGLQCMQPGKTLFITGEDTDRKLGAMLGAIMRQMGLFEERVGNEEKVQTILRSIVIKKDADLCLIIKDKQQFLHPSTDSMRKVLEAVSDIRPKMIVFDPIASFWGSESSVNDMGKAVTKFMSELVERSGACVEMINHMGKQSSSNKDMTQFAGRGGSGLPSNSRVSRVLRSIDPDEYLHLTGETLEDNKTAMLCNVNKFSDGSSLLNKPFLIIRDGYLFHRKILSPQQTRELETELQDTERVFEFVRLERSANRYPSKNVIIGHFLSNGNSISEARTKRALDMLGYTGFLGQKVICIDNPNPTIRDKTYTIVDVDGREI